MCRAPAPRAALRASPQSAAAAAALSVAGDVSPCSPPAIAPSPARRPHPRIADFDIETQGIVGQGTDLGRDLQTVAGVDGAAQAHLARATSQEIDAEDCHHRMQHIAIGGDTRHQSATKAMALRGAVFMNGIATVDGVVDGDDRRRRRRSPTAKWAKLSNCSWLTAVSPRALNEARNPAGRAPPILCGARACASERAESGIQAAMAGRVTAARGASFSVTHTSLPRPRYSRPSKLSLRAMAMPRPWA